MSLSGRNVIMVVLDSARADDFVSHAPNFQVLSGDGLRFTRAVAPAGWTLPSHASIFSGLSPTEHGIFALGTPGGTQDNFKAALVRARELERKGLLIAPRLQQRGIRTFSATCSPWLWHGSGLAAGFEDTDFFYFLRSKPMSHRRFGFSKRVRQIAEAFRSTKQYASWIHSGAEKGAPRIMDGLLSFAKAADAPFFAFANLIETHQPHYPPANGAGELGWFERMNAYRDVVLAPPLLRQLRMRAHTYGTKRMSPRVLARWRNAFRAEIGYVDRWLLRLTEELDALGLLEQTTLIVTSDHGESFGEDGVVGHGLSLSQGAGHIPLGMWGGGIEAQVVGQPVGLTSIPATLEDLLLEEDVSGSLLNSSTWGFARMEIEHPSAVSRPPRRAKRLPSGAGAAFFDGHLKLVADPFTGESLYDLERDPDEKVNLLGTVEPTSRQRHEIDAWRDRVERGVPEP